MNKKNFYIGKWLVIADRNQLKNESLAIEIEPKHMEVLCFLAEKPGTVISNDELIKHCWPNQFLSDNPLHKCIALLRKSLQDNARKPTYIKTIPKKGYMLIAPVSHLENNQSNDKTNVEPYWLHESPYMGLKPYTDKEKSIFFGREQALSEVKRMIDQISGKQYPFLLISGPNGSGKTSFVEAALIPYLMNPVSPFSYNFNQHLTFRPEFCTIEKNQENLMNILSDHIPELQSTSNIKDEESKTNDADNTSYTVLFIDQLEYLFEYHNNPKAYDRFFEFIKQLLTQQKIWIIASVRNEHYTQLIQWAEFQRIKNKSLHYDLLSPNAFELKKIITEPIKAAGLSFEFDHKKMKPLDAIIVEECLKHTYVLPLLSYTMNRLCKANKDKLLTIEAYESFSGITGSLIHGANTAYEKLSAKAKNDFELLLYQLIYIKGDRKKIICQSTPVDNIKLVSIQKIISIFSQARLFHTENRDGQNMLRITHDALIEYWPLIKGWIRKNRNELFLLQQLKEKTKQWTQTEKSHNSLTHNRDLISDFQKLSEKQFIQLSSDEKDFIQKSSLKNTKKKAIKTTGLIILSLLCMFSILQAFQLNNKNTILQKNTANAEKLVTFMLNDMQQYLVHNGTIEQFKQLGLHVIEYYKQATENNTTSNIHQINAVNILAQTAVERGNYEQAQEYLSLGNQLGKKKVDNSNRNDFLYQKSQTQYWLGYLDYLKQDYQKTQTSWQNYLDLATELTQRAPDNNQWQLEHSYALNNLGTLAYKTKNIKKAADYFEKSAKIKQQLYENNPNNGQYIADLADTISWQANIFERLGDYSGTLSFHNKSLSLSQKLEQIDKKNPAWKHRLALAHYRTALGYYNLGKLQEAQQQTFTAIKIYETLYNWDTNNQTWIKELINQYILISKIFRHQNDYDQSLFYLNTATSLFNILSDEKRNTASAFKQSAAIESEHSLILSLLKQHKAAIQRISQVMDRLAEKYPDLTEKEPEKMAYFLRIQGNIADMAQTNPKKYWAQAMQIIKKAIQNDLENPKKMATYVILNKKLNHAEQDDGYKKTLSSIDFHNPDYNWRN